MGNGLSIGPRIQVEGEEEYRKQIINIIEQSKTLEARMRALTASFTDEDTAQERAKKSSELLNLQLEAAQERTRLVRDMTEKAAAATEENSIQSLKWQQALANAEEQEANLTHKILENSRALEGQGDAMEDAQEKAVGMGDSLDDIAGKFGIKIPDAAKSALNNINGFSAGTVASMAGAAGAIAATYEIGKKLFDLTRAASEEADALLTRSAQTGIDTTTLQGIDYASRFLDFEGLDKTLVKFTQSMAAANDGTKSQAEAFTKLGVSVTDLDGKMLNSYDTFLAAIDALGKVENAAERDALANALFGKSYVDMIPLVKASSAELNALTEEAERAGYIMGEIDVQKLGALNDALQKNEASAGALKNKIAEELAPTFTLLVNVSTAAQDGLRNLLDNDIFRSIADANPLFGFVDLWSTITDKVYEYQNAEEAAHAAAEQAVARQQEQTAAYQKQLEDMATAYLQNYEAIKTSFEGQFSAWETFSGIPEKTKDGIFTAIESQLRYWEIYDEYLNDLRSRQIEGIETLISRVDDGSYESAATIEQLAQMNDQELTALIDKIAATDTAREKAASDAALGIDGLKDTQIPELITAIEKLTETMSTLAGGAIQDAENATGALVALTGTADEAYERMRQAAHNAVADSRAIIADIANSIEIPGHNAAGTDNWRGGLTWVGEQGPELVRLPRGTQIYTNEESTQMVQSGKNTPTAQDYHGELSALMSELKGFRQEIAGLKMLGRMRGY